MALYIRRKGSIKGIKSDKPLVWLAFSLLFSAGKNSQSAGTPDTL
jgi:hypothetical protein